MPRGISRTPELTHIRQSAAAKKRYSDPVERKKQSTIMTAVNNRPEVKAAHHERIIGDKNPMKQSSTIEKIRQCNVGKLRSDRAIESNKVGHGGKVSGPGYLKSFEDFVHLACYTFSIPHIEAVARIQKILAEKQLEERDIVIFLNFSIGHPQWTLAVILQIDFEDVKNSLKKIYRAFPSIAQEMIMVPDVSSMLSWDRLLEDEKIIFNERRVAHRF